MIGERLKEIRNDSGDTQQTLADKLNVSKFTIQSWEQGKSSPGNEMLIKICKLYDVSADFLLGLNDDDPLLRGRKKEELNAENLKMLNRFKSFLMFTQEMEKK